MPLQVNRVTLKCFGAPAEKMIEPDLEKRGGRSVRGNVAANAVIDSVGSNHHSQGVPAHQALDAALDFLIAWENGLLFGWNRVQVGGVGGEGKSDAQGLCVAAQPVQQSDGRFLAFFPYHFVKG